MTRELVYGRRPVRELLRGPRELHELWATERAAAQIPWLDSGPRAAGEARAAAERSRRDARPSRRRRLVRAVSLRRCLRARQGRAAPPRLPRPGHGPAQSRGGGPQRRRCGSDRGRPPGARIRSRDAGGLPGFSGRGRAPSRCGRPEPRALSRRDQRCGPVGVRGRLGGIALDVGRRSRRGRRARAGRGRKRRSPARPPHLRRGRLHSPRRQRGFAERERGRGAAPVRGSPPARDQEETL